MRHGNIVEGARSDRGGARARRAGARSTGGIRRVGAHRRRPRSLPCRPCRRAADAPALHRVRGSGGAFLGARRPRDPDHPRASGTGGGSATPGPVSGGGAGEADGMLRDRRALRLGAAFPRPRPRLLRLPLSGGRPTPNAPSHARQPARRRFRLGLRTSSPDEKRRPCGGAVSRRGRWFAVRIGNESPKLYPVRGEGVYPRWIAAFAYPSHTVSDLFSGSALSVKGPSSRAAREREDERSRPSEPVPLLLPGVGVVVVAVAFPEAGPVGRREFDPVQPFRALPEVAGRDDETHRPAVLSGQRLAVRLVRDECVLLVECGEWHVLGVAGLGMRDREVRRRLRLAELGQLPPMNAAETSVEATPARDAVDVGSLP